MVFRHIGAAGVVYVLAIAMVVIKLLLPEHLAKDTTLIDVAIP